MDDENLEEGTENQEDPSDVDVATEDTPEADGEESPEITEDASSETKEDDATDESVAEGDSPDSQEDVSENGEDSEGEDDALQMQQDLDFILDIPLELSVELGRCKMLVNDLLQLGQGSIVELNKLAGEPLDIYINTKLVARGEVVVVNEKFGVRLTDIITPMERVRSLGP